MQTVDTITVFHSKLITFIFLIINVLECDIVVYESIVRSITIQTKSYKKFIILQNKNRSTNLPSK